MVSTTGGRLGPRGDHGAAAVEFVLVVPILLLLVFGIVNFGYLFGQKLSLNQAVREGARMAVVPGGPRSGPAGSINEFNFVRDQVRTSTGGLISNTGSITATLSASEGCETLEVGEQLTVTATYPATTLFPQFLPGVPNPVNLTSRAVYRCEWGK